MSPPDDEKNLLRCPHEVYAANPSWVRPTPMFEKYNEKARRALFFARYEASKLGSRVIESEHILLGVLREGEEIIKEIFSRFNVKPEQIRREVEGDRLFVDRISSSAELPLSH